MKNTTTEPDDYAARETKTSLNAALWATAWGISVLLSTTGLAYFSGSKLLFGIFALFINASIGLAAIVAYIRFLKALDEMLRKIWIESMAMTFGALWIAFGSLIILEKAEINYIDSLEIGLLSLLAGMGLAFGAIRSLKY